MCIANIDFPVFIDAKKIEEEEEDNYAPSLIIGLLLVVPVVLLVIITVLVRLYQTGRLNQVNP